MNGVLRPRRDSDLPALAAALREVHAADAYPSVWPDDPLPFLTPPDVGAWVALSGGEVAGQVVLRRPAEPLPEWLRTVGRPAAELAVVSRLFVRPAARGRGLAEALFQAAWSAARAQGWRAVLDVHHRNLAAVRLYERQGWQRMATVDGNWLEPDGTAPQVHVYLSPEDAQL